MSADDYCEFVDSEDLGFWRSLLLFLAFPSFVLYGFFSGVWDWVAGLFN